MSPIASISSMDLKPAGRLSVKTDGSVFKRLGRGNKENITRNHQVITAVCKYWLEGRCTRNPCRFLHPDTAKPPPKQRCRTDSCIDKQKYAWKNPDTCKSKQSHSIEKAQQTILKNKVDQNKNQTALKIQSPIEKAEESILKNKADCNENQIIQKSQPPIEKAQDYILKNKVDCNENQIIQKSQPRIEKGQDYILKNKVDCNENQIIQKIQPPIEKAQGYILKNEVDCSGGQTTLKTEQTVLPSEVDVSQSQTILKKQRLCNYWVTGNCVKGEKCENLHSWFYGNGLSMVARLEGHTKAVTGIALPTGCDRLYCGSKDKSLRVLDCNSGQCLGVVDFSDECRTLVNEDEWIFAGLRDTIKAWNLDTRSEHVLRGSGGQVNAITMSEDVLFAGMEDGTILAWKSTSKTSFSEVATILKGHTGSVLSLIYGAKSLFSGSADHTIRVWNAESLECKSVLKGHTGDVTAVLCWDSYLLSGSLDKKIKVWAATGSGNIEEVYERREDDGVLAFRGMHDAERKPILLCSCKNNGVGLYDLPSFRERGRVFSRRDEYAIQKGPDGLFFTGDAAGLVSVWRLHEEPICESS